MNKLIPLVAGLFAATVYAQQPSLTTTPDPGVPFVQENADKAMKVALMVAANACPNAVQHNLTYAPPFSKKQTYIAGMLLQVENEIYNVIVADALNYGERDHVRMIIFPEGITFEQAQKGKGILQGTTIIDLGIDGHVDMANERKMSSYYVTVGMRTQHPELAAHYNQVYMNSLDSIMAKCEGQQ